MRRFASATLAALVFATGLSVPAALSQAILEQELQVIGAFPLGDWYEITSGKPTPTIHIRLDPDGTFLHGSGADFGIYPMRWSADSITPLPQETLTVHWAESGQCAYYVEKILEDGKEFMVWSPYRQYRDFGPYGGVLTRALLGQGRCRDMMWARSPDDPRPAR